jgi:hypothetical protein
LETVLRSLLETVLRSLLETGLRSLLETVFNVRSIFKYSFQMRCRGY